MSAPNLVTTRLEINGTTHELNIDSRVTLLDALRESLHLDRHEEGLRPGAVRRLHRSGERSPHQ